VYDGPDNEAEEIDTYCGSIENRTIYSTGSSLNIVFETKSGRPEATKQTYLTYDQKQATEVERRGFEAVFEISDSFVNLGSDQTLSSTCPAYLYVQACLFVSMHLSSGVAFNNNRRLLKPISQLRFDYNTTTIRRYHDAFDYDGSDRNYDLRSIRLRYGYDTTTTKN